MNNSIGIDGDPISPDKRPSTLSGNSISLIPEQSLQALRNISDICKGLTFISGIVVPEKQDSSGSICTKRTFCLDNFQHNIIEVDFVDGEFNKLESIKRSFNNIKSEWDEIKNKNKTHKKNLEKFESIKVDFIGNMAGFQSICDHSVSLLRDLESQAKIIEEYIFPYQQYTIMYYKLQNDKFSNNLKEVLNCFEIIDNSIVFFQNHPELKRTDYYVDGYKKLRIRLCNIVKNLMKNILDECQIKRSIDVSDSISDTTPQLKSDCSLENKGEYNISLYFTQLRAKGKLFNEYVRLLLQRHKETSQNDTYRSTIEDMESYYINFRISDECCGVKSFVRFGSKELYVGNSSQNCLTLNIKNLTRLALNYCKYEWITYNSFFSSSEPQKSKNGSRVNDIQRFSRELGNKARSSRGNSDEFNNFFSSLIELFGNEYYGQLIQLIRETHDPEILRESIQYLSQDILNITDDLYQSVSFPDIYLSSLLNYILKLQNSLIEQLMRCMEAFIKEKIEDYELKIDELRYPEVLLSFNADKKLIRSLRNPDTLAFDENITQKCVQNNFTSNYVEDGLNRSSTPSECIDTEKSPNDEVEIITNVCFPPNKIRLETSSDIEDSSIDEEYLDSSNDGRLIRVNNLSNPYSDKYINFSINNAINISIGSYPVIKNALLALSYIEYMVPNSTYLFLNKLIIQKCCDKLVSAKKFICSEIYFKDKISRIYHGNLFIIRNLLYLKYELVNLSKQHSQKNELEFLRDGMPKLDSHERDSFGIANMPESNTLWVSSNVLYSKTTLESIVNIVDALISSNLEELVNNICSNISLPLTKIVLQVHPEIQSSDISELQCTNHKYIKDSVNLFWNNLEFHINSYILKYLNLYLSIAGKDEMEALFSTINIETASVETNPKNFSMPEIKNESNGLELSINNVDTCVSDRFGCKCEKMHMNSIIASILPSPISIFASVKEVLVGVILEFDHVLNKRLGFEKSIIENELGWRLQNVVNLLTSVEKNLDGYI